MRALITYLLILIGAPHLSSAAELVPSQQLLKAAKVTNIEVTEKVRVKLEECNNPVAISLKALAQIKSVKIIKAAIETNTQNKQKLLFSLVNEGGLNRWNSIVSVQLDIREYNPGISIIWVFFSTEDKTYANVAQIECKVVN